jgi:hypothetical protein
LNYLPWVGLNHVLLISASWVDKITGVSHWHPAIFRSCKNCLSPVNRQRDKIGYMYTIKYSDIKRVKLWNTLYNLDRPWGHFAEWNKPNTIFLQKALNIEWFYLYEVSRMGNFIETYKSRGYQRVSREVNGELLFRMMK